MIHGQTPRGAKDLILRGVMSARGLKNIVSGKITTPDGDLQFWNGDPGSLPGLTVTASPDTVSGAVALPGIRPVTTAASAASASGGSAPYAYAWTLVSDDANGGMWSALSPNSATTQFRASGVEDAVGQSEATFRCTVTDARGATGSDDVTAMARNYGNI